MSTTYILGAGCSYGTLKDCESPPPVSRDFGRELTKRSGWEREYPELCEVAKHLGTTLDKIGLEDLWTCLDFHAKFRNKEVLPTTWATRGQTDREFKSALLRLYGRPCDDAAERLTLSTEYTLGRILNELNPGDTVISFNYDTLVERLVAKLRNPPVKLRHCSGAPPGDVVRFAKPHGSVSWNRLSLDNDVTDGPPVMNSLDRVEENRIDPLVLGAVPIKSELISQVQVSCGVPQVFKVVFQQWCAVADAVHHADRLVVLGYSFPKEDAHGRFFFREGFRQRKSDKPLQVEYFEVPERKTHTACSIFETLPGELLLHYKGKVTPAPKPETH
jgi:hypothetical protein